MKIVLLLVVVSSLGCASLFKTNDSTETTLATATETATDPDRDPAGESSRRSQPGFYKCVPSAKRLAIAPKGKSAAKDIRFRDEDYFLEIDANGVVQFSRSVSYYNAANAGAFNFDSVAKGQMGPGPHYVFFRNESPEYTYQLQPVYSYTEVRPMSSFGTGSADNTRTNVIFSKPGNNKAGPYQEIFPCFRVNQTETRVGYW